MSEWTKHRVKKECEQEALAYFLEAYELATGHEITIVASSERPDFLGQREGGAPVGIELVRIRRQDPKKIFWDRILEKTEFMLVEHAIEKIQMMLVSKDEKRRQISWQNSEETILVLQLTDIPLSELSGCLGPSLFPDLPGLGFSEIWLADYTGIEAYDDVELYCIHPCELRGHYRRGLRKPYG